METTTIESSLSTLCHERDEAQASPHDINRLSRRRFLALSSATALAATAGGSELLAQPTGQHVCLVWKGAGNDQNIWFTFDPTPNYGRVSGTPQQIGAFATATRPALLSVRNGLLMAWHGIAGDDGLYAAVYNGLQWAPQIRISGTGSSWGPALASWGPGAFMAWRGVGNDGRIWSCQWDAGTGAFSAQRATGVTSQYSPAVVSLGSKLLMVWRGEGNNQSLYYALSTDGLNWSPPLGIEQASSETMPALTFYQGKAFLAFKGVSGDSSMYASVFTDGVGFGNWQFRWQLPYFGTSFGPSLSVSSNALFMTWKGVGSDQGIYYSQSNTGAAGTWSGQALVPNAGTSVGPATAVYSR